MRNLMTTPQRDALLILKKVILNDLSLTDVLAQGDYDGLTKAICFGVCRFSFSLHAIALSYLKKEFKEKDTDLLIIILIGLYQLDYLNVPQHVVINETVKLAQVIKKPWAKNVINAVLRAHQRHTDSFTFEDDMEAKYNHPQWFIDALSTDWPNHWEAILAANNEKAPMTLRVNIRKNTRDEYSQRLLEKNIPHHFFDEMPSAILLDDACSVNELPGFAAGDVSVQDLSAQAAAQLLACESGHIVLDACAAPGGKTSHLLEMYEGITVHAVDSSESRLLRVKENAARLKLSPLLYCHDATKPMPEFHADFFDRILLDGPCSATGVIRRHPDIKLLRQESDIASLALTQAELLRALWPLLKPNGLLLYATCSVLPEENDNVIAAFIQNHPEVEVQPISMMAGTATQYGRQFFPEVGLMDGFYYSLLRKMPD